MSIVPWLVVLLLAVFPGYVCIMYGIILDHAEASIWIVDVIIDIVFMIVVSWTLRIIARVLFSWCVIKSVTHQHGAIFVEKNELTNDVVAPRHAQNTSIKDDPTRFGLSMDGKDLATDTIQLFPLEHVDRPDRVEVTSVVRLSHHRVRASPVAESYSKKIGIDTHETMMNPPQHLTLRNSSRKGTALKLSDAIVPWR